VCDYLDTNLPGWRISIEEISMKNAIDIVERARERIKNGGKLFPSSIYKKENRTTIELEQEHKDSVKLCNWKMALKGNGRSKCPNETRDYLDENLPGWRDIITPDEKAISDANNIIYRAKQREQLGFQVLPRRLHKHKRRTPDLEQEYKDAVRLTGWKDVINNKNTSCKCSNEVKSLLDSNLPGWSDELSEISLKLAISIVERAKQRVINGGNLMPKRIQNELLITNVLTRENADARKLDVWKGGIKGTNRSVCPENVIKYLDKNLIGWRDEIDFNKNAIENCKKIVERAIIREKNGERKMPRHLPSNNKSIELTQENRDAQTLSDFKKHIKGQKNKILPEEALNILDEGIPEWRHENNYDEMAVETSKKIIERALTRKKNGGSLLPKHITKNIDTTELKQEKTDANIISRWRSVLNGKATKKSLKCPQEVVKLLNEYLPGWNIELNDKSMIFAKQIVERANNRVLKGDRLLPRRIREKNKRTNEYFEQENQDSEKLGQWKSALKGRGHSKCPDDVRDYLDENLPGWRVNDDENIKTNSSSSSSSSSEVIEESDEEEIIIKPKKRKEPKQVKEKSYEEMTENERRTFIEKHLQKHKEKKGYNSTNPDDKDKLNEAFSKNISIETEGKVIFLDHLEFKTAYSLLDTGIKPEDMIIPQRIENYSEMQQHEIFGKSVVLEEFNDTLNRLEKEKVKIKGVYADYCSTLEKDGKPFLDLMLKIKEKNLLCQDAILGVTITLRNPEGVRFQGQDITIMEKKILRTFPNNENMLLKSNLTTDDEGYTYGNGAPMATWIFQVKN
jgi:ribosome modulation factor